MTFAQTGGALLRYAAFVTALAGMTITSASADQFELIYTGSFSTVNALNLQGSPTQNFAAPTPFTVTAFFDTASPNLVAPVGIPGFVAYSPSSAVLTLGGQNYSMTTYDQNPTSGMSVTIFDNTTPFGITPSGNRYGVGLLANPLADGAGFVGDWTSASPPFSATHLVSTEFMDYNGVGVGSGPLDLMMNPTVVPIPLTDSMGQTFLLTLGNYDEEFSQGAPLNTARIIAVPEPGNFALLIGIGIVGPGFLARARKRRLSAA